MSENKRALWLTKDGRRDLFAADDVDAAKAHGWEVETGLRANGEPWNAEPEPEAVPQVEAIAQVAEGNAEYQARVDAGEEKAREAERKAAEKANAEAATGETPDLKVQVVEPRKAGKTSK